MIKRRKVVIGARRIRSETLREDRYKERYTRYLEGKRVEIMEIMSNICGSR